ncbi:MAG: DEAD/DEAH box helicase [Hyphomonadaceae bacterium]|nr:DEAD/DEAH box helicase [Hyphomonadaceae bacterium]
MSKIEDTLRGLEREIGNARRRIDEIVREESEPKASLRRFWEKRWNALRDIQHRAISAILDNSSDVLISASTAAGKTEAAFLPILTAVKQEERSGLSILYVSPLKALINDQFQRLELLCDRLEMPVVRWHGDAPQAAKHRLVKNPRGVAIITPESIEALFVRKPAAARGLFGSLRFVVIDELHAFLKGPRGLHLSSLLSRISKQDYAALLRHMAQPDVRLIEQAPDGLIMLGEPTRQRSPRCLRSTTPTSTDETAAAEGPRRSDTGDDLPNRPRHPSATMGQSRQANAKQRRMRRIGKMSRRSCGGSDVPARPVQSLGLEVSCRRTFQAISRAQKTCCTSQCSTKHDPLAQHVALSPLRTSVGHRTEFSDRLTHSIAAANALFVATT